AGGTGGGSEFRWIRRDGRAIWVEAQSAVVCDATGQPVGMRGVTMDITERKQAEERLRFLAEASELLSSSLDYETTLASVARLAVPGLADWCTVDILERDGRIHLVEVAHVDPGKVELARELRRRYPPDPAGAQGVSRVIRTQQPEFVPAISDDML